MSLPNSPHQGAPAGSRAIDFTLERSSALAPAATAATAGSPGCQGGVRRVTGAYRTRWLFRLRRRTRPPLGGMMSTRSHTRQVFNVPVGDNPVLGPADALVTIAEFPRAPVPPSCSAMDPHPFEPSAPARTPVTSFDSCGKTGPSPSSPRPSPAAEAALEVRALIEGGRRRSGKPTTARRLREARCSAGTGPGDGRAPSWRAS